MVKRKPAKLRKDAHELRDRLHEVLDLVELLHGDSLNEPYDDGPQSPDEVVDHLVYGGLPWGAGNLVRRILLLECADRMRAGKPFLGLIKTAADWLIHELRVLRPRWRVELPPTGEKGVLVWALRSLVLGCTDGHGGTVRSLASARRRLAEHIVIDAVELTSEAKELAYHLVEWWNGGGSEDFGPRPTPAPTREIEVADFFDAGEE